MKIQCRENLRVPIAPFVFAGAFDVNMVNLRLQKLLMKIAVVLNQMIFGSAIDPQLRNRAA